MKTEQFESGIPSQPVCSVSAAMSERFAQYSAKDKVRDFFLRTATYSVWRGTQ